MKIEPIGIINTPFKQKEGMPIQPTGGTGVKGCIEVFSGFIEGLCDLEGFSHIILIYRFHESEGYNLKVKPFMDDQLRGVFSTRAPKRPNSIGISVVKLNKIDNNLVFIENIDILDGTPLLDIKPFIPSVDSPDEYKLGWLKGKSDKISSKLSDKRFSNE